MLVGYGGHGLSFYTHRSVRLMKIPKDSYIDYLAFDSEYLMAVADMDPNELSRTGGIYFSALTLDGDRVFRSLFKGTRYRLALDEGDQSYSFSRGDISVELIQALGEVHRSIENNFGDAIRRLKETDRFEKIRDLESVRIAILFDEGGALDSAALLDRARSRLEYVESKVRILEEFKNEIESFARQVELCRQIPSHIDPAVSNKTAAELANTPEKLSNAIKRYKKSNWRTLLGHDHELSNGLKVRFTLQEVAR